MSELSEQDWGCLRGHDNEGEGKRCEVCGFPRWVTWYTIGAAVLVVLIGLGYGSYRLSMFLQERDYAALVQRVGADDGTISPNERKQLEERAVYLRLAAEQGQRVEAEVKTESRRLPGQEESPIEIAAGERLNALQRIRDDLEQGRFEQARQAIAELVTHEPDNVKVKELNAAIADRLRVQIKVRMLGNMGGRYVTDRPSTMLAFRGERLRLIVEPGETVHFYVYAVDSTGGVEPLFPEGNGVTPNPLKADKEYAIPSPDPARGFALRRGTQEIEEVYVVSSRWPARELEQWGSALSGAKGSEAGQQLLAALQARKDARVGGNDVRIVQFADKHEG